MTSIDNVNQLAALIRAQFGSIQRRERTAAKASEKAGAGSASRGPAAAAAGTGGGSPSQRIAEFIADRVHGIPPDAPDRHRRAFRVFLESVLANEFGHDLSGSPSFQALVDAVQQRMEEDDELRSAIHEAAERLLMAPGK